MTKAVTFRSLFTAMLVLAVTASFSFGQSLYDSEFSDLPPQPNNYGKCYAKCKVADEYDYVDEQVLVKEASSKLKEIPAVYETQTEQVLVKEASTKISTTPPVHETQTERILVSPSYGKWVRKRKDPSCFKGDDCYIMCWEEVPAEYKTVSKRVLVKPAQTNEVEIPAVYKTITKKVLVSPARTEEITIPAEYKNVKKKVLVRKGGYTEWVEILCNESTTPSIIRAVQRALTDKGFNAGPVDGVMGAQTRSALTQYQEKNGLPIGNLNMETLNALGVQ